MRGSRQMHQISEVWLEHQRKRFTRCDAARYRRFDARFHRGRAPFDGKAEPSPTDRSDREWWLTLDLAREQLDQIRGEWMELRDDLLRRKANFNPSQPRIAAGSEGAGRWTDDAQFTLVADKPSFPRRLGRWGAVVEVLRLAVETFSKENLLRNLFGETVPVVAVTSLDDRHVFELNSDISDFSSLYTDKDRALADQFRDSMVVKYPDDMSRGNIGWAPNDALYHAEATVLLRAWEQNDRTLEGKELLVVVNRKMCDTSCPTVLPLLGLELGNPKITFVDDKKSRENNEGREMGEVGRIGRSCAR